MKYFDKDKAIKEIKIYAQQQVDGGTIGLAKKYTACVIMDIINNNIKSKPETNSAEKYKTKNGDYDFPIGAKFIYKGKKYIVKRVKNKNICTGCGFLFNGCGISNCYAYSRKDRTSVIFKEIK